MVARGATTPRRQPRTRIRIIGGADARMFSFMRMNGDIASGWIRETKVRGVAGVTHEIIGRTGLVRKDISPSYLNPILLKKLATQGIEVPFPGWRQGQPVPPKPLWVTEGL